MKLTEWFPVDVKPVHVGVYETDAGTNTYQYWNGVNWGFYKPTIKGAFDEQYFISGHQYVKWRGIAK